MKTVGIVCEYNPLHLGHRKQISRIRAQFGSNTAVVCAMSGNFVQRGSPAVFDKSIRAEAALSCGADLVLELPVTTALSSAEGFAAGGVRILSAMCDTLCFGAETGEKSLLQATAAALLSADFPPLLRQELEKGTSFPAARQAALAKMGANAEILQQPNDILAVEYCKAILSQKSEMDIFPICREGSYHAERPNAENPSATAVRNLLTLGGDWKPFVPENVRELFESAPVHTLQAGQRAMLGKLRAMSEADFAALPYGSEGLWRRLMHAVRQENTLEDILSAAKSKRYTRTRLDRMAMCAFLGVTAEILQAPIPYTRVLAFNDRGRSVLKCAKAHGVFCNAGEKSDHPYWQLEQTCGDLYGLFAVENVEPPEAESRRRVVCRP